MWEDDPRYQNAIYRFLIGTIIALTLIATVFSILEKNWEFLRSWFLGLGVIIAAICLYALIIWLIVQVVRLATRLKGKVFQNKKPDA
jgi:hypothetical protein